MLDKRKIFVFVLGNVCIGAAIVMVVLLNIFALRGITHIAVSGLTIVGGLLGLYLLSSWSSKKKSAVYVGNSNDPYAGLKACAVNIGEYLRDNKSTDYFREKLAALLERIHTFGARCESINSVIIGRFGNAGLSYGKFTAPVTMLSDYLVRITNGLMSRMRVFNEEEYVIRIAEFTRSGRRKEADEYRRLEKEYMDYTEMTLAAYDASILKLDQLSLEISKLNEGDAEQALSIMGELDEIIKNTSLYE